MIFDVLLRLEPDPHQRDLARGWAAELADPAWLLGRQWQMGEHQGEDASSPVRRGDHRRGPRRSSRRRAARPRPGDRARPGDLESEPDDWWTPGRRVRIGRAVAAQRRRRHGVTLPADGPSTLAGLPVALRRASTAPARTAARCGSTRRAAARPGRVVVRQPARRRTEPVDLWDPAELAYTATLPAGDTTLDHHPARRRRPRLVPAPTPPPPSARPPPRRHSPDPPPGGCATRARRCRAGGRSRTPRSAIGGQAPDRANLATLVLVDLIVNHSDDWFTVDLPARAGQIITLDQVTVIDSFGDPWPLTAPKDWSLFAHHRARPGVASSLWATARTPLAGPVLDEVVIGIDEDANLVWAVEQVVAGRTMPTPSAAAHAAARPGRPGRPADVLLPADDADPARTGIPTSSTSSTGRRRFVQGRAADLSGPHAGAAAPAGQRPALRPARRRPGDPVHQIEPGRDPVRRRSASSAAPCWHGRPPASQCSGRSGAGSRCSRRRPSPSGSTSSTRTPDACETDGTHLVSVVLTGGVSMPCHRLGISSRQQQRPCGE